MWKINDFGYILPNSCFSEQHSIPVSEYMQQEIFSSLSEMKTQEMNTQESKERRFKEKVREKGEQF